MSSKFRLYCHSSNILSNHSKCRIKSITLSMSVKFSTAYPMKYIFLHKSKFYNKKIASNAFI